MEREWIFGLDWTCPPAELEALAGGAEEQGSLSDGPESVHDFFDTSTVKNQVAK
jgi:hypothetical protein